MAITAYTSLLPYLVKDLPDCPQNVILQVVQQKTRDFCYASEGLFDLNRKFALVANQKVYTLAASQTYYEIIRVFEVRVTTAATITAGEYGTVNNPMNYVFRRPTTLEFDCAPASYALANGLEVDLVVAPLQDTTSMDFDFVTPWARFICAGVLAELKSMPGRPWSDPVGVSERRNEWDAGVAWCRRESYTHRGPLTLKMRGPSWV